MILLGLLPLLPAGGAAWAQPACEVAVARLVSAEGPVELERGAAVRPVALDDALCPGDLVRVGPRGRAALALADGGVLRLDQGTTLRVTGGGAGQRSLLDLFTGALHFLSRSRRALEIGTPFVNAAVEGTEFVLRVAADRAQLAVFEGRVRFENPLGRLTVASGEAAEAEAGRAPVLLPVAVRPRDAVRWTLYYPPVLTPLAAPGSAPGALPPALAEAAAAASRGELAAALARLERVPEAARDATFHALRAGLLLSAGRADEAQADIERALALRPEAAEALALRSVIAVVQDDRERALADARRAAELEPGSAAAALALSYALQARFALDEARAVLAEAVGRHPEDPLLRARLAELELMRGDVGRAHREAEAAAALAPELGRARTVLGFVELARIDLDAAEAAFRRAVALEPGAPLGHLGLGLALVRRGGLAAGRREIEVAAGLDPGDALLRSYLGKAYFEEGRDAAAAEAFATAKALDPLDPTPFFYDAIREQLENRPVEALRDLGRAIERNDNRAVYRSRLLLDEDLAARGARLGTIYRDLGFEQLALVEGWKSVAREPANHAAHRLLADTYSVLPLHGIAQDSELLQSQLLQPLNIEPVQPRLATNQLELLGGGGPTAVTLNEYTGLFVANQASLLADGLAGSHGTFADDVIASGIYNRYSLSVGQSHFETDGFRENADLNDNIYNVFGQAQLTPDTSLLAEFRSRDAESGDLSLRFGRNNFAPQDRSDTREKVFRIGGRHSFAPNSTLIGTYAFSHGKFKFNRPGFELEREDEGHLAELRHILQWPRLNLTGGLGYFEGDEDEVLAFGSFQIPEERNIRHRNAYIYSQFVLPRDVLLSVGLSVDDYHDVTADRTQVNPKLGVIWYATPNTTLRAAAFRTLKRTLISSQTIEPAQVAGFNQFFDDTNGTDAWRLGIGLDQRLTEGLFAGAEISRREQTVPLAEGDFPLLGREFDVAETFGRAYGYWTPADWLALSLEYRYQWRDDEDPGDSPGAEVTTHSMPVEARLFHPSGFFARARATFVDQSGRFGDVFTGELERGSDQFWVADAAIGYRFPNRRGLAALEVRNLFDERFEFQDIDFDRGDPTTLPERTVSPERTILGRLILRF